MNALKHWDIFCKIVDNFGDIGVCWRLARQLQIEHGLQIRLWIDDLEAAQKIIPNLNLAEKSQVCEEIIILKWQAAAKEGEADFSQVADVVIEAFSCELPAPYLAAMVRKKSKWINLEYLSAEPWVLDFHAKPSPQHFLNSNLALTRHFYFPGFTEATGGLIRENNVVEWRDKSNNKPYKNHPSPSFPRKREYIVNKNDRHTDISRNDGRNSVLKVSLFCYPNAPIHDLLTALQANKNAVDVYVPACGILPKIADYFDAETIEVGDYFTRENLDVHILPFLSQADYDQLLADCDVNFVRGEDSWVRAIWAGKSFIWQPYFQDENAHIKKLNAFLDLFYANLNAKDIVCEVHRCWSVGQLPKHVWSTYLQQLLAISSYTLQQSQQLAKQQDLAAKLVIFCNKI